MYQQLDVDFGKASMGLSEGECGYGRRVCGFVLGPRWLFQKVNVGVYKINKDLQRDDS